MDSPQNIGNSKDYEYLFNILFCGNSKSGKTSIVKRIYKNQWDDVDNDLNVDYKIKTIYFNGKPVKLQLFEQTKGYVYYCGANSIIIVYDCTDMKSFQDIGYWLSDIDRYASDSALKYVFELIRRIQTPFKHFEVSAKYSTNIDEALNLITNEMIVALEIINTQSTSTFTHNTNKNKCSVQ
ncbi:hypothetical protein ACTA71_004651 [Dictyostelium dimigraforme]